MILNIFITTFKGLEYNTKEERGIFLKKIILLIITILVCTALVWLGFFQNEKSDLKKVRVAEVTHSIFYAPQYLAHSLGYFEEE